jgi:hypothetical protein
LVELLNTIKQFNITNLNSFLIKQETETTVDTSPDVSRQQHHHQQQHYFEEQESPQHQHHRKRLDDLSPLDLLPDPSQMEMDPEAPLRQSPASALPPVSIEEREEERSDCVSPQLSCRGEYVPLNPDIDRPSPPRQGAARVFENPFELVIRNSCLAFSVDSRMMSKPQFNLCTKCRAMFLF